MASLPSRPLKVGLVLDDGLDKPDGVQQYILAVGTWLQAQGHQVHYLVGETSRTDIPHVHSLSRNVRWHFNGNSGTMPLPANRRRLRQLLDHEQFDILHVQMPYSPFMAHRLIKLAGTKTAVVGSFHIAPNSGLVTLGTRGLGLWLRRSLRRFDHMLSVSPAASRFAEQTFNISSDISPNVVDYPRFRDALPFDKYNDDIPTILFLGRLVPRKGCHLLLEAVRILRDSDDAPTFRVVVCGRGELEHELKRYVTKHQLEEFVEFTGFVSEEDKPRYYASADISVFPSSGGESFGIVLLEAMASGNAAVLAGDNPGYRSVMEDQPDLLFDPHDAVKLAGLLKKYLLDDKSRKAMQSWGKGYTARFDVATVGAQLEQIYRNALQKRTGQ